MTVVLVTSTDKCFRRPFQHVYSICPPQAPYATFSDAPKYLSLSFSSSMPHTTSPALRPYHHRLPFIHDPQQYPLHDVCPTEDSTRPLCEVNPSIPIPGNLAGWLSTTADGHNPHTSCPSHQRGETRGGCRQGRLFELPPRPMEAYIFCPRIPPRQTRKRALVVVYRSGLYCLPSNLAASSSLYIGERWEALERVDAVILDTVPSVTSLLTNGGKRRSNKSPVGSQKMQEAGRE